MQNRCGLKTCTTI